jgi:hypothetical protein
MAEIPQGALEANFPSYVKEFKDKGDIEFNGKAVKLVSFGFLGVDFATGVNKDLGQRLRAANIALYGKAFGDRVDEAIKTGQPIPAELTKEEFRAWCWKGQFPTTGAGVPQIRQHGGAQDRGNSSSKHSSGSAVDINYQACPWMPVRNSATQAHGGEFHKTKDPDPSDPTGKKKIVRFKGDFRALYTEKLWKPAFEIFDRANSLFHGKDVDLTPDLDMEPSTDAEKVKAFEAKTARTIARFGEFSYALESYFRYAFHPANTGKNPQRKTLEEFKSALLADIQANRIHPQALHVDKTTNLIAALQGPDADAVFQAYFDKIAEDHAFMPRVITVGKLITEADGSIIGPAPGGQRDPCDGVCNIRPEVLMELIVNQKLRWGGAMFGIDSGDTMHFDLDGHFIDGKKVS